jgi:hypothetical protein
VCSANGLNLLRSGEELGEDDDSDEDDVGEDVMVWCATGQESRWVEIVEYVCRRCDCAEGVREVYLTEENF